MKLLLVGNHTCSNRGDSAILCGIVQSLEELAPGIQIDIVSRYAQSSRYLIGRDIRKDTLSAARRSGNGGLVHKVIKKIANRFTHKIIISHIENKGLYKSFKIPPVYQNFINEIKKYDALIKVGGSFFVDLYGSHQFDHALCDFLANKPIFMVGHSVNPFQKQSFNDVAHFVFKKVDALILCESVSLDVMKKSQIPTNKVIAGIDTAWLVKLVLSQSRSAYALEYWRGVIEASDSIAMTFLKLAPFDKCLGITQQEYMTAFANLINEITRSGKQVIAFSTCTGIDSYHNDDRMIALHMKDIVESPDRFHVIMDKFNDLELGELLSHCKLTIGTRLHSAIISINFGTPAIAINYEHKSLGIMQQLGLPELAVDIK
ncbi:colanic acid biosynthesis protein [Sodalis glossinidius str. 'morsitans']|uniref:Amylovoran biosynthesis protein AmsJ n=1 Tax=Sodalis glossinidius (strain morsitans) TaxID=343509 RepID=Q2NUC3_SODGM|nr:amylovoran biosynthesis protein AmsJ [Sodalis glossinidius str. 'morsitans']CRL44838.1 colanic acid biosynthesis protein [Sodalis glossinidius str. 'morsitans']